MSLKRFIDKMMPLSVKQKGENNMITCPKSVYKRKSSVKIYGNNNKVIIKEGVYLHNCKIQLGFPDFPVNCCYLEIGEKSTFNECNIMLGENNSRVVIGSGCMFSFNIEINCTDTHAIFDENNNLINKGEFVEIGSKVWVCKNAVIMKNTKVPSGSIVAQNAIVTKVFEQENAVYAGNPARCVKTGISWSKTRPNKVC